VYLSKRQGRFAIKGGWFFLTWSRILKDTLLTQRIARPILRKLKNLGAIETCKKPIPGLGMTILHFKVNINRVDELIKNSADKMKGGQNVIPSSTNCLSRNDTKFLNDEQFVRENKNEEKDKTKTHKQESSLLCSSSVLRTESFQSNGAQALHSQILNPDSGAIASDDDYLCKLLSELEEASVSLNNHNEKIDLRQGETDGHTEICLPTQECNEELEAKYERDQEKERKRASIDNMFAVAGIEFE